MYSVFTNLHIHENETLWINTRKNALKDCNNKRQFLRIQIFEICAFKQTQIFTAYTGWSKSKALIRNIDNGLGVKL